MRKLQRRLAVARGDESADLVVHGGRVFSVFTREWRYLEDGYREQIREERRRYEDRWRRLFQEGVESGGFRTDLDTGAAALLVLSAANWAYTWLTPDRDTDELADRFYALLVDGIRGYATPH